MNRGRRFATLLLLGAILTAGATAAAHGTRLGASPLDGRWTATITQARLRGRVYARLVPMLYGRYTARYANGHFEFRNHRTGAVARGTFTLNGNVVRIVFASGIGVQPPNNVSVCTWSIYKDRLTFKTIHGRPSLACDAGVWTRAG